MKVLTERQWEIGRLITEGLLNKQIASRLNVSEGTIKNHISKIFKITGCRTRTDISTRILRGKIKRQPDTDNTVYPIQPLSPKEKEIIDLVMQGYSNEQIAKILHNQVSTIKNLLLNIKYKSGILDDKTSRVKLALRYFKCPFCKHRLTDADEIPEGETECNV